MQELAFVFPPCCLSLFLSFSLSLFPFRLLPRPFHQGLRLSQWADDGWWWVVERGIVGTERQGLNKEALSLLFRVDELLGVGYDWGRGVGGGGQKNGKLNIEKGPWRATASCPSRRALARPGRLACAAQCLLFIVQCLFSPFLLSVQLFPKKHK